MATPQITYRVRAPYPSEIGGYVAKAIIRYRSHYRYSNDGLDSKWYIVEINNEYAIVQALDTRGSYSSPWRILRADLMTHFEVVPVF